MTDYYKVLGIESSASQDEIKKAYRKLSIKFHPDKNNGDIFFENMFKQIQEAYEILGSPQKRKDFDQKFGNQTFNQFEQNKYSNFEPVIEYFEVDNTQFYNGDEIRFKWKTYNADLVEVKPFGIVASRGSKKVKLNNVNKEFIAAKLIATNTNISKSVSKEIILENKIFKDARGNSNQKEKFTENPNQNHFNEKAINDDPEKFWSYKGRLRRKDYFIRAILLSIPVAIMNLASENSVDPSLLFFASIIITIQAVKRLHDINMSGWYWLLFLIPIVNLIFGLYVCIHPTNYI